MCCGPWVCVLSNYFQRAGEREEKAWWARSSQACLDASHSSLICLASRLLGILRNSLDVLVSGWCVWWFLKYHQGYTQTDICTCPERLPCKVFGGVCLSVNHSLKVTSVASPADGFHFTTTGVLMVSAESSKICQLGVDLRGAGIIAGGSTPAGRPSLRWRGRVICFAFYFWFS